MAAAKPSSQDRMFARVPAQSASRKIDKYSAARSNSMNALSALVAQPVDASVHAANAENNTATSHALRVMYERGHTRSPTPSKRAQYNAIAAVARTDRPYPPSSYASKKTPRAAETRTSTSADA